MLNKLKSLLKLFKSNVSVRNTNIANDPMEEFLIREYRPDLVEGLEILTKSVPIKYG